MKSYSLDLRERVVRLRAKGEKQARIAEVLGVSISKVKRYLMRQQQRGSVAATVQRRRQPLLQATQLAMIEDQLRTHSDATVAQHVALFAERVWVAGMGDNSKYLARGLNGSKIARWDGGTPVL